MMESWYFLQGWLLFDDSCLFLSLFHSLLPTHKLYPQKLASLVQDNARCEQLQKEVEELKKQREEWSNAREQDTLKDTNASSEQTSSASTATNLVNGIKKEGESSQRSVEGENVVTSAK